MAENFGLLSSCDRDLKPARFASGKSTHHLSCEGPLGIPLQSVQGHMASSRVEAGTSGFLSSSDMDLGVPMEFQQGIRPRLVWRLGTPLPSRDFKEVSGFLSSGPRHLGLFLEVPWDCHTSLCVLSQSSGFKSSQCRGIRLIWSGWGNRGLFQLRYVSWGCTRVSRLDQPPLEGQRQHRESFPFFLVAGSTGFHSRLSW